MAIQTLLQQAGGTGENAIGGRGRHNNEIDILRLFTCGLQRPTCSRLCKIDGVLTFNGNMPLTDTGTLPDPLIRRINDLFKILVGQHLVRQVTTGPCDARINQTACLSARIVCNCELMSCGTFCSATTAATSIALQNASASAPP